MSKRSKAAEAVALAGFGVAALGVLLLIGAALVMAWRWAFDPRFVAPPLVASRATAMCMDGTFSASRHRSGTCSHHDGVQVFYGWIAPRMTVGTGLLILVLVAAALAWLLHAWWHEYDAYAVPRSR